MSTESGQKKLSELRVIELKAELEKRKIDQSGVKAVLIKRLQKALLDDGKNPETFLFDSDIKQNPAKKKKDLKVEEIEKLDDEVKDVPAKQNFEQKFDDEKGEAEEIEEIGLNGEDEYEEMETEENLQEHESDEVYEEIEDIVCDEVEDGHNKITREVKVNNERELESEEEYESATLNEGESEEHKEAEGAKKSLSPAKGEAKKSDNTGKLTPVKKTVIIRKIAKKTPAKQLSIAPQKKEKTVVNTSQNAKKESNYQCSEKPSIEYTEESVDEDEIIDLDELVDDEQINGMDNEDSINLNIGEEDTKFITEEAGLESDRDSSERKAGKLERTKKSSDTSPRKGDKRHSQDRGEEDEEKNEHRNLWVSNLSSATRATDLKHLFSKYGKVVAAKIVTNAKTPGARCYGFVTMATKEDAAVCIKALNVTELHGRLISVETVANKPSSNRKAEDRHKSSDRRPSHDEKKKKDEERAVSKESRKEGSKERSRTRDRKEDPKRTSRNESPRRKKEEGSPERINKSGVLTFQQIIEERERYRLREKERALRDQERRTKEERERQRDMERRNRDEAARLERVREKLKMERERIEKERSELLRLERDRLEREKEELKRQQMKLEEARRLKRTLVREEYESSRKRPAPDSRHFDVRAPFESSHRSSSDYKKEVARDRREVREVSPRRERFIERPTRREEVSRNKERYERVASGSSSRRHDDRRDDSLHRSKTDSQRVSHHSRPSDRFESSSSKGDRYGSSGDTWGSSSKGGSSGFVRSDHHWSSSDLSRKAELAPWSRPPPSHSDRWANVSAMYPPVGSGMASMSSLPMTSSTYQMADRFDAYKQLAPLSRKF